MWKYSFHQIMLNVMWQMSTTLKPRRSSNATHLLMPYCVDTDMPSQRSTSLHCLLWSLGVRSSKSLQWKCSCEKDTVVIQEWQNVWENENNSLKPPRSWAAKLSARKATRVPFILHLCHKKTSFILENDKIFTSSMIHFKIGSMPLFFIVYDLAIARRNIDFKLDLSKGCMFQGVKKQQIVLLMNL